MNTTLGWLGASVLFFAVSVGASIANATSAEPPFPRLLSYRQLMELTPAARVSYMSGVRELLVELEEESRQTGSGLMVDRAERVRGQIAWLDALIPEAQAQLNASAKPLTEYTPIEVNLPLAGGLSKREWSCVHPDLMVFPVNGDRACVWTPANLDAKNMSCPKDFVAVGQAEDGSFDCMTKASFKGLKIEDQLRLRQSKGVAVGAFEGNGQEVYTPNLRGSSDKDRVQSLGTPGVPDLKDQSLVAKSKCSPKPRACARFRGGEKERNAYRTRIFARGENPRCIYAGNISRYKQNVVGPKRCEAVSDFFLMRRHDVEAERKAGHSIKPEKACEKGEIICNPLVFGVKKSGEPFCVTKKQAWEATTVCNRMSSDPAGRSNEYVDLDTLGVMEAWDEFAEDFNEICKSSGGAREFFCRECNIIGARLAELNLMNDGDCGSAVESGDRLKQRGKSGQGSAVQ